MLILVVRTLILYIIVIIAMRIMGKRQLGELQPSELVVAIMISDLASVPMQAIDIPLISGILPVMTLIIAEVMMSYLSLKSKRMRKLLSGEASIIIYDGQIDERELARLRFNINDLLEELRLNSCHDVSDVQVAVIETSGKLSIIPKDSARTATTEDLALKNLRHDGLPCTIVSDGVLDKRELERSGKDIKWFESEMKKRSINRIKDIFIASLDAEGELFIQLKRRAMK
ncbi:MAG: DUF421 domain-containing protein [Clostridia bacterium]|jgi:uncharacterized membrane protein YcaP (DUF421 family)|nr:DUF421 domain-containing protein [Clostridia bacterium]MCI8979736.1 DUF421 domain-containing protein [Clostridia bacterium]NDO19106.1 DUF421 domain-containing protein [Lachnospiraceae bacterium MD329]